MVATADKFEKRYETKFGVATMKITDKFVYFYYLDGSWKTLGSEGVDIKETLMPKTLMLAPTVFSKYKNKNVYPAHFYKILTVPL